MPSHPIKIACLGDSLTNGRVSYNWVKQLSREMKDNILFSDFGKDGDLAFNALQRLDPVIAMQPDIILILLGTNDVNGTMGSSQADAYYEKNKKLPRKPTQDWYIECMQQMIDTLKSHTNAEIVIISIPVLGEDLDHEANRKVRAYNASLQTLCKESKLSYLDFHARQVDYLIKHPPKHPRSLPIEFSIIKKALLRRFLLRQSWNTIGEKYGLMLTTDTIHLNETSGKMLAKMVQDCIYIYRSNANKK